MSFLQSQIDHAIFLGVQHVVALVLRVVHPELVPGCTRSADAPGTKDCRRPSCRENRSGWETRRQSAREPLRPSNSCGCCKHQIDGRNLHALRRRSPAAGCSLRERSRSTRHSSRHRAADRRPPSSTVRPTARDRRTEPRETAAALRFCKPSAESSPGDQLRASRHRWCRAENRSCGSSVFFTRSAARQSTKNARLYFKRSALVQILDPRFRFRRPAAAAGFPSAPCRNTPAGPISPPAALRQYQSPAPGRALRANGFALSRQLALIQELGELIVIHESEDWIVAKIRAVKRHNRSFPAGNNRERRSPAAACRVLSPVRFRSGLQSSLDNTRRKHKSARPNRMSSAVVTTACHPTRPHSSSETGTTGNLS